MDRTAAADIDAGLRSHMVRVYNYMLVAIAVSGAVAFFVGNNEPLMRSIFFNAQTGGLSMMAYVIMFSPLGLVMLLSFGINRMSFATAQLVFWAYASLVGLSLSTIFLTFTDASIVRVFMITAVMFGAMSLYGYTTKTDLSKLHSFLMMGIIGILLAMVVNMIFPATQSPALSFAIDIIGVLIFTVLTAVNTQSIKNEYYAGDGRETAGKKALMGALSLYISFVNMFIFLLHLMGGRE
jgi:FtsH-binding integral membrane protein